MPSTGPHQKMENKSTSIPETKNSFNLYWLALAIILLSTLIKIYSGSVSELYQAQNWVTKNNAEEAVRHFDRAIRWYLPFSPITNQAAEGIWNQARKAEQSGDPTTALKFYRILRGSFYASRSLVTPGRDWIARTNDKIATLMAKAPPYKQQDPPVSLEQRKAEALEILFKERPPYTMWALLGEIGFLGWVTTTLLFIFKGMDKKGRILPGLRTRVWIFVFLIFYSLWILGMYLT